MLDLKTTKYKVKFTSNFKKNYKKVLKQGKKTEKFLKVLGFISNDEPLDEKYKNHKLVDDKNYKDCYECHIEPDWLLIYKIKYDKLILLLFTTDSIVTCLINKCSIIKRVTLLIIGESFHLKTKKSCKIRYIYI